MKFFEKDCINMLQEKQVKNYDFSQASRDLD